MSLKMIKNLNYLIVTFAASCFLLACAQSNNKPVAPKATPVPVETYVEHTISYSGETLAEIALWYTGKASNWTAIRDANPSVRPDRLRLGQTIQIPRSLVTNEKPFTRKLGKKKPASEIPEPEATPSAAEPTPAPASETPSVTPTEAPVVTEAPAAEVPTAAPTPVPTLEPIVTPEVASPQPTSKDMEREKLLDELLK